MAEKVNKQLDLQQIALLALVLESLSSAPTTPAPINGRAYYDTTATRVKLRENGAWVNASQTGSELQANKDAAGGYPGLTAGKLAIGAIPTGATGTTVPFGNDARFSDVRVPTDASVTGGVAGAGVKLAASTITFDNIANTTITLGKMAASATDAAAATASLRTLGTTATSAAAGNDARLSDTRTPTAGSVVLASLAAAMIDAAAGTASARTLAFTSTAAMPGNATLNQVAVPTAAVSMNSFRITNLLASSAATDAVNRAELDAARQGISGVKDPVLAVAQGNVVLSAPGATIDGITMAVDDRFLAPAQTTATERGIYQWKGAAVAAVRALDADATGEILDGTILAVAQGTDAGKQYIQTATPSGAPGAWTQVWTIYNTGGTTYLAGVGLSLTGTTFTAVKDTTDATNPIVVSSSGIKTGTIPVDHGGSGATTAAAARINLGAPGKYTITYTTAIAAGVAFTITHNLNTQAIVTSFRNTVTNEQEGFLVIANGVNTMTVTSDIAIASPSYEITVIG